MVKNFKIHEGKAIKLYLFVNDIDSTVFAKSLNVSRVWLYKIFDTEIQSDKTWKIIEKLSNVNKQSVLNLYYRCYNNDNSLHLLSINDQTIEKINKLIIKNGPMTLY